jgi:sulfite reductase (NADPH) flavoprotein alpha-component
MRAPATLMPTPSSQPGATGAVTILYATESGNAEGVAKATARAAAEIGLDAHARDMMDVTPSDVAGAATLLVVAATAGEGDAPDRAVSFFDALMSDDAPSFAGTRFSVLALGDRAYANFCGHGEKLDARLERLGGTRLDDLARCDFEYEADASAWVSRVVPLIAGGDGALAQPVAIDVPGVDVDAVVTEHRLLHGAAAERQSAHLRLAFASPVDYRPGDLIDIVPVNDAEVVEDLLAAAGIDDPHLGERLRTRFDVTTLTADAVAELTRRSGGAIAIDTAGSRLVDAIRASGLTLDEAALLALLRPIAPRSYSIASSPLGEPGAAELLVSESSWPEPRDPRGVRRGVASDDLIARRRVGDRIRVRVKPSPHFRLPDDPATDIVMIAAGSGVAPFRGFVQHRHAIGATGRAWLVFGHRRSESDFLYEPQWRDWLADGSLTRLDTAFSRDQPDKVYVQHVLEQHSAEVSAWIDGGAVVYICGDRRMGQHVEGAIGRIGHDPVALARAGRLRKDTY